MYNEESMHARHRRWHEMSKGKKALTIARWALFAAFAMAIAGLAAMLLWNWVMARVLGLPRLGYWEALGLLVLARILLGGRGASLMARMRMKRAMRERMASMPEDAEGKEDR